MKPVDNWNYYSCNEMCRRKINKDENDNTYPITFIVDYQETKDM